MAARKSGAGEKAWKKVNLSSCCCSRSLTVEWNTALLIERFRQGKYRRTDSGVRGGRNG